MTRRSSWGPGLSHAQCMPCAAVQAVQCCHAEAILSTLTYPKRLGGVIATWLHKLAGWVGQSVLLPGLLAPVRPVASVRVAA